MVNVNEAENKRELLSMKKIASRDYVKTKRMVDEKIKDKYEEYIYACHEIMPPKITQSLEVSYEQFIPKNTDKVGNYVARKLDLLAEANDFYYELVDAMKLLTNEELVYFTNYLNNKTEEYICEKIHNSPSGLKRIKHSAIIKIGMYFNIDIKTTC